MEEETKVEEVSDTEAIDEAMEEVAGASDM